MVATFGYEAKLARQGPCSASPLRADVLATLVSAIVNLIGHAPGQAVASQIDRERKLQSHSQRPGMRITFTLFALP